MSFHTRALVNPRSLFLRGVGPTAEHLGLAEHLPGQTGRASAVLKFEVDGSDVFLLVRMTRASNGHFVDVVPGKDLAELAATVAGMEIVEDSHPFPVQDPTDEAALAAAAD